MNRADSLFWRPKARTTPHAAEHLGRLAVDLLPLLPHVAEQRPDAAVPGQVRVINARHQQQRAEQQPPVDEGQHDQPAEELDDRRPGIVEHAEDQLAHAAGVLAQQARCPARLELVDAVERQPHRVLVDLAAHRDLDSLRQPRGLPSAREAQELAQHRDHEHDTDQHREPQPGRFGDGDRAVGRHPLRQRPRQHDVVDRRLGRGRAGSASGGSPA